MQILSRDVFGMDTSRLAYGCMTLGGLDQADADRALDAALDGGITLFDHADIYARGRSEEVFGQWLANRPGLRERLVLQTKCGIRRRDEPPGAPPRYDASYEHVVASAEGSLRRLGVETLDVLLLHRPDPLMDPEEVAYAFSTLRAAGKVRRSGSATTRRPRSTSSRRRSPPRSSSTRSSSACSTPMRSTPASR